VTCYNALTGAEIWTHWVGSGNSFTASPVASDGKIYIVDDNGVVNILKAGPEYILVAKNPLGEGSMVAPAITDNIIFFRTLNYLTAVSGK
jgi:outer membrane protein assembly factor BamB